MEVENFTTEKMLEDVLNNPKQGKVFREFIGDLMNAKVDYDDKEERNNMSDRTAGVIPEEAIELNMVKRDYHIVSQYRQEVGRILQYLPINYRSVLKNRKK